MQRGFSRGWSIFRHPAWLGRPELALAFSLLCGTDFYFVAARHPQTPAGSLLNFVRVTSPGNDCGCSVSIASIYDAPEGPRLLSDEDSADELTRLYATSPDRMYAVYVGCDNVHAGLIAPWWSRSSVHFQLSGENDARPSAAVEAFARQRLKAKYFAGVADYNVRFLSDPDPVTGENILGNMVWWGIGHDLIFLGASAFAVANLACAPGYLRRRRTERRLQRHECPKCRYQLGGLPSATLACPECGQPLPAGNR